VLSFDMGGTTAKICLIRDMTPKTSRVFEVARTYRFKKGSGMPISVPVIDMVEIGAGGGSLAHVDVMRQIRVGPESAGSDPGPACYGRGGERPAVTDADLVLGRLDPDWFAGGTIALSIDASRRALADEVGSKLGMDEVTAAYAVSEVVGENMANAARAHAVENGEDLGGYTMIAFGGAAPIHAGRLAEKLGVRRILVPPGAGVGSAIGFLRAPFSFEATRSTYLRLSEFSPKLVADVLAELRREAADFVRECDPEAELSFETKGYFRYVGQGWEIPVDLPQDEAGPPDRERYKGLFETAYQTLFGRVVHGLDIEITSWSVRAATPAVPAPSVADAAGGPPASPEGSRSLYDAGASRHADAALIRRDAFGTGQSLAGPAVVTERETTVIVPPGFTATMQPDGCIDLRREPEASPPRSAVKGEEYAT
jgi:N-methylhydantoinase A